MEINGWDDQRGGDQHWMKGRNDGDDIDWDEFALNPNISLRQAPLCGKIILIMNSR